MNRIIKNIIVGVIVFGTCMCLIYVYPLKSLHITPFSSETGNGKLVATGGISQDNSLIQEFYPQVNYLESIGIVIQNLNTDLKGELIVTFYNSEMNKIFTKKALLKNIPNYEYYAIKIKEEFKTNEQYFYLIQVKDYGENEPCLFATSYDNSVPENGESFYNNELKTDTLAVHYNYLLKVKSIEEAIPYFGIILMIGITLILIVKLKKGEIRTNEKNQELIK